MSGYPYHVYSLVMGGFVTLFLFLFGAVSNSVALHFFLNKMTSRIFSKIFSVIALTDILTALLTLFVGASYLANGSPLLFDNALFREIWGSLWNFSTRYSVYLVAVLSITRTWRILLPFSEIREYRLYLAMGIYAVFLLVTTPTFYSVPHYYKEEWCALALNKSQFAEKRGVKYSIIVMSIPVLLFLPLPLTLVSAVMTTVKISRHNLAVRRNMLHGATAVNNPVPTVTNRSVAHQSGVTVVLFAVVYLVLNVPYCIIYMYVQIMSEKRSIPPPRVIPSRVFKMYVAGFTHVLSISLNAAINPLLYYWRMVEFREYVNSAYRNFRQSLPCRKPVHENPVILMNRVIIHTKSSI